MGAVHHYSSSVLRGAKKYTAMAYTPSRPPVSAPNFIPMAAIIMLVFPADHFHVVTPMFAEDSSGGLGSTENGSRDEGRRQNDAIVVAFPPSAAFSRQHQVHGRHHRQSRIASLLVLQDRLPQERCSRKVRRRVAVVDEIRSAGVYHSVCSREKPESKRLLCGHPRIEPVLSVCAGRFADVFRARSDLPPCAVYAC